MKPLFARVGHHFSFLRRKQFGHAIFSVLFCLATTSGFSAVELRFILVHFHCRRSPTATKGFPLGSSPTRQDPSARSSFSVRPPDFRACPPIFIFMWRPRSSVSALTLAVHFLVFSLPLEPARELASRSWFRVCLHRFLLFPCGTHPVFVALVAGAQGVLDLLSHASSLADLLPV
jgi:hypothetical protein